ncbi:MAG TPA: hypothetical protein H9739_08965 [Candidatus Agathobaculum pullistercoris]|nr:hypothetical protein [Candidatus Agathobaculum pullistercoris]
MCTRAAASPSSSNFQTLMRRQRSISGTMGRPHERKKHHGPKTPSSPAAYDTLSTLLADLGAQPADFDCIVTGDLGHVGADLLLTLLREDNIDLIPVYSDCGSLLFGDEQDAHAGGSGCGCSAAVLCGPLLRDMQAGKIKRLVFAGTGAMMSPTSVQQGQPIAGICHAVVIERSGA